MDSFLPLTLLLPFFVTSVAVELTPGPNMAYLALLSMQRGRGAGLLAVVGVSLGLAVIGAAAAFGFANLVAENRFLYELVRWAGVGYLVWLAFDGWRESRLPISPQEVAENGWAYFNRGLITNLLNPKAFVFYVSVLPSFTDSQKAFWPQGLQLTFVYVLAASLVHLIIVMGAGSVAHLVARDSVRRLMGTVFAILLVIVAVWLAFNTAQQ